MKTKGIFITGTDTGVGKTVITASLAAVMLANGLKVSVMKPAESGCTRTKDGLLPQDAEYLRRITGINEPLDLICPYRFEPPLAPGVAAELAGIPIDPEHIIKIYQKLSERYDINLVEGAGGLLVPLCKGLLYIDLIKRLGIPMLVVARAGLGTINHTLLTIWTAKNAEIEVLGVILNRVTHEQDISEKSNPHVLQRLLDVPLLGVMPHLTSEELKSPHQLASIMDRHINWKCL
nr:dethiobiotin synthase [Desulfobacterales bacterium]